MELSFKKITKFYNFSLFDASMKTSSALVTFFLVYMSTSAAPRSVYRDNPPIPNWCNERASMLLGALYFWHIIRKCSVSSTTPELYYMHKFVCDKPIMYRYLFRANLCSLRLVIVTSSRLVLTLHQDQRLLSWAQFSRRDLKTGVTVDNNIKFDVLLSIVPDPVLHQAVKDTRTVTDTHRQSLTLQDK